MKWLYMHIKLYLHNIIDSSCIIHVVGTASRAIAGLHHGGMTITIKYNDNHFAV